MENNRILSPEKDYDQESNVRPVSLESFVGQKKIKENLKVYISAAKMRGDSLDHILFYGPPGLGKTTLSQIIAYEMQSNIKYTSGPALTKSGDLAAILSNLEEKDVLFIDEIHRIPISVEEVLYSAMEDFKIDFIVGEGPTARSLRIDVPKFTLVGATTRYGLLSSPLRDRFGINEQLNFYDDDELEQIVNRTSEILEIPIEKDAAIEVAKRSRGTPRIANRLMRRIRDFFTISNTKTLTKETVIDSLLKMGVDSQGFDDLDRKYLHAIVHYYQGGPVGIDTIATMLSESKETIEDTIEPYFIQQGYISRTPRGRVVTSIGWEYINNKS